MRVEEVEVISRRRWLQAGGLGLLGLVVPGEFWAQGPEKKTAKKPADSLEGPPIVSAKAWAIAEGRTGRILWSDHETIPLAMASTSKIMTAWLVIQHTAQHPRLLDDIITVSEQAAKTGGSSARIQTGDRYTVRDLLHGLMLPSGNDAAVALAEHFGPLLNPQGTGDDLAKFVAQMNNEVRNLRMGETRYLDPHGLGGNRTSARDLVKLAHAAMQIPLFRQLVQTVEHRCETTNSQGQKRPVLWTNTNRLLEMEGFDGIKTGTTAAAGFCLVSSGRRGDDHLLVVVLGATSNDSRYIDSRNLYRWAWSQRQRMAAGN